MSGSNSSAPDDPLARDPLQMTVYDLSIGPRDAQVRRTRRGRSVMLLVLAACAAPVVASYLAFFVWRPEGRNNYGTLIQPTRSLPAVSGQRLDGNRVPLASLKGQWLLVVVGGSDCGTVCEKLLHAQRQLREMLGRERDRLDKVWLITDDRALRPALQEAVLAKPPVQVLRVASSDMSRWLAPEAGREAGDHLYLVDPMGEWMMRFPADAEPAKVKRDLERVLRASSSWDRPGR